MLQFLFRDQTDSKGTLIVLIIFRSNRTGEVEAVQTSKNTLYSKKAIVVAAGCWSGSLMHDLLRETEIVLDIPVKPRKVRINFLARWLEDFDEFSLRCYIHYFRNHFPLQTLPCHLSY